VRRLDASANHSSENESTFPPRAEEIRSGRRSQHGAPDGGVEGQVHCEGTVGEVRIS
jgi:hypothetical protein